MPIAKAPPPISTRRDTSTVGMGEHLLPLRKVAEIVGFARSTINKKIIAGVFPRPVKPNRGRASRWLSSEIQGYIADAVTARDRVRSATLSE